MHETNYLSLNDKIPFKADQTLSKLQKTTFSAGFFFDEQTQLFVFICGNGVNIGLVMSTEKCQMAH